MSEISAEWKELRPQIGNLISRMDSENCHLDAKLKELQEKDNEAYKRGLQDAQNAVIDLYNFDEIVPGYRLYDVFGIVYPATIIKTCSLSEIIEKLNQLKNKIEQEKQELHVGDEVAIDNGLIGIITDVGDDDGTVWLSYRLTPATRGLDFVGPIVLNVRKRDGTLTAFHLIIIQRKRRKTNELRIRSVFSRAYR